MRSTYLAAVLFVEIGGFKEGLHGAEGDGLPLLSAYRDLAASILPEHGGELVDATQDELMVLFPSAVGAVQFGLHLRLAVRALRDQRGARPALRIGIHLGEIWRDEARAYGNGVNVAARVMQAAAPGQLLVSEDVYRQISNKLDLPSAELSGRELKNIERRLVLYELEPEGGGPSAAGGAAGPPGSAGAATRGAAAASSPAGAPPSGTPPSGTPPSGTPTPAPRLPAPPSPPAGPGLPPARAPAEAPAAARPGSALGDFIRARIASELELRMEEAAGRPRTEPAAGPEPASPEEGGPAGRGRRLEAGLRLELPDLDLRIAAGGDVAAAPAGSPQQPAPAVPAGPAARAEASIKALRKAFGDFFVGLAIAGAAAYFYQRTGSFWIAGGGVLLGVFPAASSLKRLLNSALELRDARRDELEAGRRPPAKPRLP